MEKVRIGNDLKINFSVYRNGEPESFDGATNISTKIVNESYNKTIDHTYSIVDNVIQFNIDALELKQCGKCRVFISYTKVGDYTVDSPAFELVQYTEDTGGTEVIGIEIVKINISGDIGINRDGASAYEVWVAYPGNEGKTIEQYFEWLRENPTKIDLDGLNSNLDKLHFKPDTLVQLANIGDVRYSQESRTLEVKVSDTVSIQLGQEMQTRVKNDEAIQINNGQMVYINSAAGANPLAKLASTTNADIAQRTFGMATENIPANGFGAITTEGLVRDINTSAFPEGAMLWLGTNGSVTNIEPLAPVSKISVGMVLRSNANNGVVYVKIRAIARNQKLSDVYAPTITGGDILRWNSTTLRFETFNITSALSNKVDTSRTITAGNGLTGGGNLTEDMTINVVNTDDSIVVSADGIKVDTQDTLTSDSVTKPLSANQGKTLQDNKAEKTRNIVAGAGLTGGGDLTVDRTINVATADDSLVVAADSVKVNTNNTLTSTSTTQPLSANQGKVLNEKVVQVETDLNDFDTDFINALNSVANNIGYDLGLGKKTDDTYRLLNIIGKRTGYVGYLDNYTLHGFEYTPNQNDDIVTLIGNSTYNTTKPIQSQMRPFEELISTKERFYLRDDVTKRIDGSASNLTNPDYLQKVYIPEFWYGAMFDSVRNKIQLWFSLIPVTGFMHIAQQAVCRYPGYIDGTGKARSHSGFKYPNNKNLIEFTAAGQLTSTDLFVLPYYTYNALSLLLLHDIGRRNAQAVWTGLKTGSTYSNITSGKTDGLTAPSGEVPADAETASNKPFRWRFIENIYGDCWKIMSGVYCNQVGAERRVMICADPYKSNTNSVISADYVQACIIAAGEGWLKDINAPWINAKAYGASSTTGYSDYTYNNTADKTILIAGGHSGTGASGGPFCLDSYNSASYRSITFGALFASIDRLPAATQVVKPALIY